MYISFGLLVVVQVITSRYLKLYWRYNILAHTLNGCLITFLVSISIYIAVTKAVNDVLIAHRLYAVIFLAFFGPLLLVGISLRILHRFLNWKIYWYVILKKLHMAYAFIFISFAMYILITGLEFYQFANN
jgi:hypothetical protein